MADDLSPASAPEQSATSASRRRLSRRGTARSVTRVRSPHAEKFRIVLASLIGIAVGALAIAGAVLVAHDGGGSSTAGSAAAGTVGVPWSSWKPTATGNEGAAQIADYVAPFYRLSLSEQLAVITPINVTQLNAASGTFTGNGLTVALNIPAAAGNRTGQTSLRPLPGQTVAYDLCGQGGPNCTLGGTPSTLRLLLLRREALELALYTFRYLRSSENVVAVLPPGHTRAAHTSAKPVTVAVLFQRADLAPLLNQPLDATLQRYPPAPSQLRSWKQTQEAGLVDTVTSRNLFSEQTETQQDGSSLLVLNPLPAQ